MAEISIIVPVYKTEKYLKRCVDSILAQTFTDFELILVDDGSPDNCGEICDEYACKDSRVRVIHKENGGVSSARNVGMDYATGEYILFCDSDDVVKPIWCEVLYELIHERELEICFCGYEKIDQITGNYLGKQVLSGKNMQVLPQSELWLLIENNLLNMPWNKIYSQKIIQSNGLRFQEDIQYNEDLLFVLGYIQKCKKPFGIVDKVIYCYSQGIVGSLTKSFVDNLWEIKQRVFIELDETLEHCDVDKTTISCKYYSKLAWAISESIASVLADSKLSKLKKVRALYEILNSSMCKKSFVQGKFDFTTSINAYVLKTRSASAIIVYNWLSSKKRHFRQSLKKQQ